jgi:hypothetical protein
MARKHTPLTSKAERGIYGALYGARKEGKPVPSYVPESLKNVSQDVLKMHLEEAAGKKLPKHAKKSKGWTKIGRGMAVE